jgi:hypothetical protein
MYEFLSKEQVVVLQCMPSSYESGYNTLEYLASSQILGLGSLVADPTTMTRVGTFQKVGARPK